MKPVRVAQIGSGFISDVHVRSFRTIEGVEVVCQHDNDKLRGKQFCKDRRIPEFVESFDDVLKRKDVDCVSLGLPNWLHYEFAIKAAKAGKHIICEKPLALRLEHADEMLEACEKNGLILGYGEELCYVPKNVHAKTIADAGAVDNVFFVKQHEKHAGPYSPWFFKSATAGGGILMDMGCHAIECCRWVLGKPAVKSVYCQADTFLHNQITDLDDHIVMIIEFETGQVAEVESSWTLKGGMISNLEIHGTGGVIYADLLQQGMGLRVFSEKGYEFGGEDAPEGWHYPDWEWLWNNGYPQEMRNFIDCIRHGGTPIESGADGRVVLEIMIAGYLSAATGRKIMFPFQDPGGYDTPVDIWLRAKGK
ncbi:MAG TPA: Gfo/Idh/MocA family oxidoreductase [bacterium]|nr:Gfo/Idh/MocA family oxidoreductase [bacterium]